MAVTAHAQERILIDFVSGNISIRLTNQGIFYGVETNTDPRLGIPIGPTIFRPVPLNPVELESMENRIKTLGEILGAQPTEQIKVEKKLGSTQGVKFGYIKIFTNKNDPKESVTLREVVDKTQKDPARYMYLKSPEVEKFLDQFYERAKAIAYALPIPGYDDKRIRSELLGWCRDDVLNQPAIQ